MSAKRAFRPALHGLRGFAASGVVVGHVSQMGRKKGLYPELVEPWRRLADGFGPFMVLLFFCLSGFLIVDTLQRHQDPLKFARDRIIRIYPVFLTLQTILFVAGPFARYEWLAGISPETWARRFVENALFLPGLVPLSVTPIAQENAWSLSYEAGFYVVAAMIFFGATRKRPVLLALGIVLAVAAIWFRSLSTFFLVGVAVWRMDRDGEISIPAPDLVGPLALIAGFATATWIGPIFASPFVFAFFAAMVQGRGRFVGLFTGERLCWLGTISYSLYLVHPFALDAVRRVALKLPPNLGQMIFPLVGLPLALALSWLSWRWLEKEVGDRLRGRAARVVA